MSEIKKILNHIDQRKRIDWGTMRYELTAVGVIQTGFRVKFALPSDASARVV